MAESIALRHTPLALKRFGLRHIPFFNLRMRSLARGTFLSFAGVPVAGWWSVVSGMHPTPLLVLPVLLTTVGIFDTARCMKKKWDFYHAGVLLLLYAGLMALSLLGFLLIYPYLPSIGKG